MRIVLIVLAAFSLSFMAGDKEKYDVKDGIATVNGKPIFRMEYKDKWATDLKLQTLDGKDVAFFKYEMFRDKNAITQANPEGKVHYYDVLFYESGAKCEMSAAYTKKGLARELHYHNLVLENVVNYDAIKTFVMIHGTKFSEQRRGGTTVIINN
jgi:hypothetical protein